MREEEYSELEAILGYTVNFRTAKDDTVSNKQKVYIHMHTTQENIK